MAVKIRKANQANCLKEAKLIFTTGSRKAIRRYKEWWSWGWWKRNWPSGGFKRTSFTAFLILLLTRLPGSPSELLTPGAGLSGGAPTYRLMKNFFINEASSGRIMYGFYEVLNKNWRGKTLKPISTT
jgi:hypothetical protein